MMGRFYLPDTSKNVIRFLINVKRSTFIALGEISTDDARYLMEACAVEGYEYKIGVSSSGRSSFDTCYIYDASKIAILNVSKIENKAILILKVNNYKKAIEVLRANGISILEKI